MERCDKSRIAAFDAVKGLGICCVMLGHDVAWGTPLSKCLFSFHIPLFFFVSGVLFRSKSLRDVVRKSVVQKLLPYFFFSMVGLLFWPLRESVFPTVIRFLGRMFYSFHPVSNGPVWFLMALAILQCLYVFGSSHLKSACILGGGGVVLFSIGTMISLLPEHVVRLLPAKIGAIALGGAYFVLGQYARGWAIQFFQNLPCAQRGDRFIALVYLLLLCFLQYFSKGGHIGIPQIHDALFFPMSACGILFVFYAVRGFSLTHVSPLAFIGRNSLYYFTLDFCSLPIVVFILRRLLPGEMTQVHMPLTACHHDIWLTLLIFVMNLCGVTLLMFAVKPFYLRLKACVNALVERL